MALGPVGGARIGFPTDRGTAPGSGPRYFTPQQQLSPVLRGIYTATQGQHPAMRDAAVRAYGMLNTQDGPQVAQQHAEQLRLQGDQLALAQAQNQTGPQLRGEGLALAEGQNQMGGRPGPLQADALALAEAQQQAHGQAGQPQLEGGELALAEAHHQIGQLPPGHPVRVLVDRLAQQAARQQQGGPYYA